MSNDPNDPKRKKKYDKGGYHPENGRRIPPIPLNPPNPPIENEMKIYVNPNNPNDYIYLDAGVVEIYDIPPQPQPKAHPMRAPMGPPMGPPMRASMGHQFQDDDSDIDEDLLRLRRVIKNTKKLNDRRPNQKWDKKIDGLADLLDLANHVEYVNYTNISLNQAHLLNLQEPLQKLNDLIGMESIKSNIFNQLVFFLQKIEENYPHMLHTCIQGTFLISQSEIKNCIHYKFALRIYMIHQDVGKRSSPIF